MPNQLKSKDIIAGIEIPPTFDAGAFSPECTKPKYPKPKWKRISEKAVYKGRVHIVEHEVELLDGQQTKYEVDHGTGYAACVLIKTKNYEVLVTYQYRFPLDHWIYDIPGGGSQPGETPEQTAIRDCQEEAGV